MPRRILKRWFPNSKSIRENKSFKFLGHMLHEPGLWHLNRRSVAKAFFIGLFVAMLPIPSQMLAAGLLAIWLNANLPISVSLVWITNPLTMAPVFYFNYLIGNYILRSPVQMEKFHLSMHWIVKRMEEIWWPLLTGSIIIGLISGILGAAFINAFWHWHVRRSWAKRKQRRSPPKAD